MKWYEQNNFICHNKPCRYMKRYGAILSVTLSCAGTRNGTIQIKLTLQPVPVQELSYGTRNGTIQCHRPSLPHSPCRDINKHCTITNKQEFRVISFFTYIQIQSAARLGDQSLYIIRSQMKYNSSINPRNKILPLILEIKFFH